MCLAQAQCRGSFLLKCGLLPGTHIEASRHLGTSISHYCNALNVAALQASQSMVSKSCYQMAHSMRLSRFPNRGAGPILLIHTPRMPHTVFYYFNWGRSCHPGPDLQDNATRSLSTTSLRGHTSTTHGEEKSRNHKAAHQTFGCVLSACILLVKGGKWACLSGRDHERLAAASAYAQYSAVPMPLCAFDEGGTEAAYLPVMAIS